MSSTLQVFKVPLAEFLSARFTPYDASIDDPWNLFNGNPDIRIRITKHPDEGSGGQWHYVLMPPWDVSPDLLGAWLNDRANRYAGGNIQLLLDQMQGQNLPAWITNEVVAAMRAASTIMDYVPAVPDRPDEMPHYNADGTVTNYQRDYSDIEGALVMGALTAGFAALAGPALLADLGLTAPTGATIAAGSGIDEAGFVTAFADAPAITATLPELPAVDWTAVAQAYEGNAAISSIQNAAIAEVTGQVPAGSLAQLIGQDAANAALSTAREITGSILQQLPNMPSSPPTAPPSKSVNPLDAAKQAGQVVQMGSQLYRLYAGANGQIVPQVLPGQSRPPYYDGGIGYTGGMNSGSIPLPLIVAGAALVAIAVARR